MDMPLRYQLILPMRNHSCTLLVARSGFTSRKLFGFNPYISSERNLKLGRLRCKQQLVRACAVEVSEIKVCLSVSNIPALFLKMLPTAGSRA